MTLPPLTLVLGGARSGKSRHAEALLGAAAMKGAHAEASRGHPGSLPPRRGRNDGTKRWGIPT